MQKHKTENLENDTYIDLDGLCSALGLTYFHYKEYLEPEDPKDPNKDRDFRHAFFIHEQGETLGVNAYHKRDLAWLVCNFSAATVRDRKISFPVWAGKQGYQLKHSNPKMQPTLKELNQ